MCASYAPSYVDICTKNDKTFVTDDLNRKKIPNIKSEIITLTTLLRLCLKTIILFFWRGAQFF